MEEIINTLNNIELSFFNTFYKYMTIHDNECIHMYIPNTQKYIDITNNCKLYEFDEILTEYFILIYNSQCFIGKESGNDLLCVVYDNTFNQHDLIYRLYKTNININELYFMGIKEIS